ncbi:MAG: hypothetical protein ACP5EP_12200 [Acidobacteriaceae bacterium]
MSLNGLNGYWAYGLRIHADLECPELPFLPVEAGSPDVIIRLLPPAAGALESMENGHYEVQPGAYRLAVPGVALYRVEEGCRIFITPLPDVPAEKIRLFLLGSTMGALLYQRGLLPLHGSAVETPWGAMIFVGAQGAGKSTLAAQFHRKGYRLLSDDVCAVTATPEGLWVLPALAQFRLCADAYERLGTPQGARFDVDKFVVPMGEGYCPHPAPLRAVHLLADHDSSLPEFKVLRGFDRVQCLLENLYRPHYLKGQETQGDLMRLAGLIAQKATLVSVTRQRDPEAIDRLVGFLESTWAEHFSVATLRRRKN